MLAPLLALTLAADPFSVAIPGLNAVRLAHGEGELYTETLSQRLMARGLKVISSRDMSALLGLDRQKQLLSCGADSCTAELASALGVDALAVGDIGQLGTDYALNVKLIASKDGTPLAIFSGTTKSVEQVPHLIDHAAHELVAQLAQKTGRSDFDVTPPTVTEAPTKPLRTVGIVAAGVGTAGLIAGGVLFGLSSTQLDAVRTAPSEPAAASARDAGKGLQTGGAIALAAGGTLLAAGLATFFLTGSDAAPTALVTPDGATFGVAGSF